MTNKTEDRFYFGKPGQPERFARDHDMKMIAFRDRFFRSYGEAIREAANNPDSRSAKSDDAILRNAWSAMFQTGYADAISVLNGLSAFMKSKASVAAMKKAANDAMAEHAAYKRAALAELGKHRFSRPGQPERFAEGGAPIGPSMLQKITSALASGQTVYVSTMTKITKVTPKTWKQWEAAGRPLFKLDSKGALMMGSGSRYNTLSMGPTMLVGITMRNESSRPGQPERFGLEDACWEGYEPVGTKQKDGRTVPNCVPKDKNEHPEEFAASGWQTIEAYVQVLAEEFGTPRGKEAAQVMLRAAESLGGNAPAALRNAIRTAATSKNVTDRGRAIGQIEDMIESASFSRPGQPDKFDASSLDRGNFAEASKSPMLGKLLSEKAMPDGGWRAVQVGSDTLVISFEDADLARDFGRRAASKGYSATSPVATTGRYWNVEVKNG